MNQSNQFPSNAMYSPSGFNDNNFNRASMPSNTFPINGGMVGNYVGRFNPLSTNTQHNMNLNSATSFPAAFDQNTPMIEKIDYTNKNNFIHNNVAENVLDEHVVEYRVIFDSADRDIKVYPSPFAYTVKFNPMSATTVETEEYVNPKNKKFGTKIVQTRFAAAPSPIITKEFKNVKYVKLENVVLPQFSQIKKNKNGEYEFDPCSHLTKKRFVTLAIKELDADRVYATFDSVTRYDKNGNPYTPLDPFAIIIPDKLLGLNFYSGVPYYGSKIYKNSLLGNITQMSIQFSDSRGLPLRYDDMFTYEDLEEYEFENHEPLPTTDLRNPHNEETQTLISLIIGVVESQINTNTKFDQ